METKRVVFISEAPYVPSSLGKVVMGFTTELARRGHEVAVITISGAAGTALTGFETRFNPRRDAESRRSPLAELYPDVEVTVVPWGKVYPLEQALERLGFDPDAVVVYGYPYTEQDLNHMVYNLFTSRGRAALVYALHEGPFLAPEAAVTVLAYSHVATPTRFVAEQYVHGLARAAKMRGIELPEGFAERRFSVVPHGLDPRIYGEEGRKIVEEELRPPREWRPTGCKLVVGMVAKNHVRKDFGSLIIACAILRKMGIEVCPGAYMIDAVTSPYWSLDAVTSTCREMLGVDMGKLLTKLPDRWRVHGVPEEVLISLYVHFMDLHLFLTRGESFGLPPLESALLGVPTVTSDIPPQREIFEGTGIPVVPSQVEVFDNVVLWRQRPEVVAEILAEWLGKLGELRRITSSARSVLVRRFSLERAVDELERSIELALRFPEPLSSEAPILSQ